jgi:hypothetical protein
VFLNPTMMPQLPDAEVATSYTLVKFAGEARLDEA